MNPRFTFSVPARDMAAIHLLTASDLTREELRGVLFWFQGPELTLVGTDGRRMGVLRSGPHSATQAPPLKLLLELSGFEIWDSPSVSSLTMATVEVFEDEAIIRVGRNACLVPVIKGLYPCFWEAFPSSNIKKKFGPVPVLGVDSGLLRSFGEVPEILQGPPGLQLQTRGPWEPIEVFIHDRRFFGILMPMQIPHPAKRQEWTKTLGSGVGGDAFAPAKGDDGPLKVVGATIQTHSGIYFDLRNPSVEQVDVRDIAHALANIARFTGHTRGFYSVAQHSVLVSRLVPDHLAYAALLHDAAEAYCGDVSSPLKTLLPEFKETERRIFEAIVLRLCILDCDAPEIHKADLVALATERRDLMPPSGHVWGILKGIDPAPDPIIALDPSAAELEFITRFNELNPGFAFQGEGGAS